MMDPMLEESECSIQIVDDLTVDDHTEAEHDTHLWKLIKLTQKHGLVFKLKKTHIKAPAVKFFRCLYDENRIHLDPEIVIVIHSLPTPTNVTELWGSSWHGNIPQFLQTYPVHLDFSPVWDAQERCWLQLG